MPRPSERHCSPASTTRLASPPPMGCSLEIPPHRSWREQPARPHVQRQPATALDFPGLMSVCQRTEATQRARTRSRGARPLHPRKTHPTPLEAQCPSGSSVTQRTDRTNGSSDGAACSRTSVATARSFNSWMRSAWAAAVIRSACTHGSSQSTPAYQGSITREHRQGSNTSA